MFVIPVIDIKEGKCARVFEGHNSLSQYYCESPIKVARLFRKENFKAIHITDLDGAVNGEMRNYGTIKEIVDTVDIPVQLGGGIRNFDNAKRIIEELGVYRIVLGTAAIVNPDIVERILSDYSPSKLVVGIDEKMNNVVKNGWIEYANITPLEFAMRMDSMGVQRIVYQDVTRVGNFSGPHIERLKEIGENTKLKITSAGGIGNYKHLKMLEELKDYGVDSAMVSKALYENKFPCQNIWRDIEREDISLELPKV
ncbi:MAG: 1-(5-phosphoribosyl)-5-[(5-phosphoribosylamino)methylideneamino] imidazole-4-carboxamide isomerase [Ignavibacteriae bacterium]|nr:1-(5-phosphoribosyl)-5-[(5-phosphoribosylamino)methylideneamino] imidazole-4-carboxamide isomerase [Ignavibacteriota bacterium]